MLATRFEISQKSNRRFRSKHFVKMVMYESAFCTILLYLPNKRTIYVSYSTPTCFDVYTSSSLIMYAKVSKPYSQPSSLHTLIQDARPIK
jgi:hypothetical protein